MTRVMLICLAIALLVMTLSLLVVGCSNKQQEAKRPEGAAPADMPDPKKATPQQMRQWGQQRARQAREGKLPIRKHGPGPDKSPSEKGEKE